MSVASLVHMMRSFKCEYVLIMFQSFTSLPCLLVQTFPVHPPPCCAILCRLSLLSLFHVDVLQTSHDKSSKACSRRIMHMMKNQSTVRNVSLYLSEAHIDKVSIHQSYRSISSNFFRHFSLAWLQFCCSKLSQILWHTLSNYVIFRSTVILECTFSRW